MATPRTAQFTIVLRILRYVKGTLLHGLHFLAHSSLILSGYFDADWAGDPIDHRFITSYYFFLGTLSFHGEVRSKQSRLDLA